MGLDGDGVMLMVPEPGEHGPTEAQGEEGNELTQTLAMAEVGGFEVKASGFEGREEGLNAPAQPETKGQHLGQLTAPVLTHKLSVARQTPHLGLRKQPLKALQ